MMWKSLIVTSEQEKSKLEFLTFVQRLNSSISCNNESLSSSHLTTSSNKTLWSANYSACVVYTKTNSHLSVGESDGYLPPLR